MKICESECIPLPFKAACPQVSFLCCPRTELGQLLVLLGERQALAFSKMEMILSSAQQAPCIASQFRYRRLSEAFTAASLHAHLVALARSLFPPALLAPFHQFRLLREVCSAPGTLSRQSPTSIAPSCRRQLGGNPPLPQSRAVTVGGFCLLDTLKEP